MPLRFALQHRNTCLVWEQQQSEVMRERVREASSFFQEACLQWLEQRDIPREQVRVLLEQSLQAILASTEQQQQE